jgi:hypothetical protein
MALDEQRTLQSNIKNNKTDMTGYSLFLGGLNVKRAALEQYNVLKTGKGRIFLTKMPFFMKALMPEATKNFRHVVEYGFMDIQGIQDLTMEFDSITGGYAGRSFEIPTILKDETNEITIKILEFAGSPMREYLEMWMTGVSDPNSGFTHYHGLAIPQPNKNGDGFKEPEVEVSQANHTMEAFYVMTDQTGFNIEFACMLCNMFPKTSARNHFNHTSGEMAHVELEIAFTCTMYTSPDINAVAQLLLNKYRVLYNFLDFKSETGTETNEVKSLSEEEFPSKNIKDWTFN